ncbi:methyltransferase domain-containing protein [Leptospira ognonensis]|uniref:tRNA (guanine-N(7)-)-methyltransferase n=1 Tax=Leptospira ognonensis TaxID=2484945 RepID=A0A4R9KBP3_9LEPT|nr:methyltransferase [Leptospira ognonensis]TGL62244.1 methyltransferase domain-containing protein [Leptospira ognonensis]
MIVNPDVKQKLWKFALRTPYTSDYLLQPKVWGKKIDLKNVFPKETDSLCLELGSGWGEVAIELAKRNPNTGFLLMEKKIDRVKATEAKRAELGLENIRYMTTNFQWFFTEILDREIFDTIIINFPDPWPKRRHHKNRAMQAPFLEEIHTLLRPNGRLLFATDYGPYARKTILLLRKMKELYAFDEEYAFERPNFPVSFFESEKRNEGKKIYYLERRKVNQS